MKRFNVEKSYGEKDISLHKYLPFFSFWKQSDSVLPTSRGIPSIFGDNRRLRNIEKITRYCVVQGGAEYSGLRDAFGKNDTQVQDPSPIYDL